MGKNWFCTYNAVGYLESDLNQKLMSSPPLLKNLLLFNEIEIASALFEIFW